MNESRDSNEHDLPAIHPRPCTPGSNDRPKLGDMAIFIKNGAIKDIMAVFAADRELHFGPAIVPALLERIAELHPPAPMVKHTPAGGSSEDVGSFVRAVLRHVHNCLGAVDTILLADILTSTGKLVHLQGMRFWFSNGGAGGLGAKSLLTLVANAADLPPAQTAHIVGAVGRLGSGEQGLAAMGHGLGQRALDVVHLWDSDMLLEALHGLVLLQRSVHAKGGGSHGRMREQDRHGATSRVKGRRASAPDRGMVGRVMLAILEECEGKMDKMTIHQLQGIMGGLSSIDVVRGKASSGGVVQVSCHS
jgi:hypothetical protein